MNDSENAAWPGFRNAAQDYIDLIDDDTAGEDTVTACQDLHELLLNLQLAALALPETPAESDDPAMVTEAKRADRAAVAKRFDFRYRMPEQVLEIAPRDRPADIRNLAEDLSDLYDELQDILALDDQGYKADALSQARNGYVEDWGYLVVSAQAALWKYIAEAMISAEEAGAPEA